MKGKAVTHPYRPGFMLVGTTLKACLLLGCCLPLWLTGGPAHAQDEPVMPDLESLLPPPQEMQDDGEASGLTLLPEDEAPKKESRENSATESASPEVGEVEGDTPSEAAPAIVATPIPPVGQESQDSQPAEAEGLQPVAATVGGEGWKGSLMFDDEKVDNLLAIYRAYLLRQQQQRPETAGEATASTINVGDIIGELTGSGEKPKEIVEEVLKLSLNSIVFDSPAQWSMWVNGQRFSRKEAQEGFTVDNSQLRVLQANNREITYLWTPITESYNLVRQRWEDKQNRGEIFTNTQVAQNDRVEFDEDAHTVTITLRPNQTFVSQFMSVMEGVEKPRAKQAAEANEASAENVPKPEEERQHAGDAEIPAHERAENTPPVKKEPDTNKLPADEKRKVYSGTTKASPLESVKAAGTQLNEAGNSPVEREEAGDQFPPPSETSEPPAPKILSGSN